MPVQCALRSRASLTGSSVGRFRLRRRRFRTLRASREGMCSRVMQTRAQSPPPPRLSLSLAPAASEPPLAAGPSAATPASGGSRPTDARSWLHTTARPSRQPTSKPTASSFKCTAQAPLQSHVHFACGMCLLATQSFRAPQASRSTPPSTQATSWSHPSVAPHTQSHSSAKHTHRTTKSVRTRRVRDWDSPCLSGICLKICKFFLVPLSLERVHR